ncbi:MAG: TonB-dependent siderophore receptor [Cyanobacteria bacterium P01_B01_bin.77]
MNNEFWRWPLLAGVVVLMVHPAAVAETVDQRLENLANGVQVTVDSLAQGERIEITDVQIEDTATGFTLRLVTNGELVGTDPAIADSAALVTIPNAVLQLTDGDEFLVDNPADEITLITVTNVSDNQVQIAVTGTDAAPDLDISTAATGLLVSVTPGIPTVQAPDDDALRIVVTGEEEDDYFVPNATTATRTDAEIFDIPASIQVIPQQVLEDQQVIRIEEVLRNVSGVTFTGTGEGRDQEIGLRGFDSAPILRNGFRLYETNSREPIVIENLERIEVLKGPTSILYGEIQPGGVVNVVTKKPLAEPYYAVELQLDSRELIRPSIDLSGPLTSDSSVRYRLNALYENSEDFRDFDTDIEQFFISPVLAWDIGEQTDLTVQLEYLDQERPSDFGLIAAEGEVVDIPFDRIIGEPDDLYKEEFLSVGYDVEHRFNENWKVRNAFRYRTQDFSSNIAFTTFFEETTGTAFRSWALQEQELESYSLQSNVLGEFTTGSIEHDLLFGVDLDWTDSELVTFFDLFAESEIDIFNPVYGTVPRPDFSSVPRLQNFETRTDRLGVFLQDQISFFDNLILVGGLRYDTVDQELINGPTFFDSVGSEDSRYDDAVTPRIGLVYQPSESISLYGSYSRSFTPNSGVTSGGDFLEPEEGEGFEVGVKAELLRDKMFATLAFFDIIKQNVATADPNDPFASVATGELRSRGIELDISGEILPGWNVIASYRHLQNINSDKKSW